MLRSCFDLTMYEIRKVHEPSQVAWAIGTVLSSIGDAIWVIAAMFKSLGHSLRGEQVIDDDDWD